MSSEKTNSQDAQPKEKTDPIPDSTPVADPPAGGVFSNISASASNLLSSITGPSSASLITDSLASSSYLASTKSSNQEHRLHSTYTDPSTSAGGLSTDHHPPSLLFTSTSTATTRGTDGFRSRQPHQPYSVEDEFASFERQLFPQLHESQQTPLDSGIDGYAHTTELESDGHDVVSLLSQPLTSAIYSPDLELQGMKLTNPTIRLFVACDDPVEFLSTLDVYTEEVWGDAVEVVRQAREEILADRKGKQKQGSHGRAATERLRMIWGHLKGTPV
ncbi:uncharacterized protein H6S33_002017 [Morchella sextelata]|uniref:uncharacterized protein n=1 Tax=Morchella sextelata TaxID=1174677 RepID=UPI001D03C92E|nr:uncharacterized protein H6S33_002017 [Morchella sextelata]KAH0607965.1 hypothetical protein H6S33_002017 [Morchella sextelata]